MTVYKITPVSSLRLEIAIIDYRLTIDLNRKRRFGKQRRQCRWLLNGWMGINMWAIKWFWPLIIMNGLRINENMW